MIDLFKGITTSLARKLIITVGLLMFIGGGVSWYVLINAGKKNLMSNAVIHTASYSDLVKKSTHYSMLTLHRQSIQQTIESMGATENIRGIRIFNSKGKIFYSSEQKEIGAMVDRGSFACKGCHEDPERPEGTLTSNRQWVIYKGTEGSRILTFVDPVYNEPSCYTTACHAHPRGRRVLGILETDFSLDSVDKTIQKQTRDTTIYAAIFLGVSSLILYFVLRRFILKPVSVLSHAMGKVAKGDLNQIVSIPSRDEMGLLADTFNLMTKELAVSRERMNAWTQTLEDEIAKKTAEILKSQDKLIRAEKLASLGRLTADVAHEIRNPLSAIGGFARRLYKIVTRAQEKEYAGILVAEVDRLEKILRDILTFSRDARFHLQRQGIEGVVHTTLSMYVDLCTEQSVHTEVKIGERLPPVLIDSGQVGQALGNLITNAIDAMPDGGTATITADTEELHGVPYVFVRVTDTGQGMSGEKLPLIFEPFYSTKETGHGTGLGLSIVRKIVEEHGGFIKAESAPGKGSAFNLYFPYQSEEESRKAPCWEYMKCGRDKDATMKCPAHPYFGRICWVVAGTFCEGKVQGTFAQKYEDCKKCEFYRKMRNKEIELAGTDNVAS